MTHENTIPPEKWGKDHCSTLLYIETRAVDHAGWLDNRHMRCDWRIHPAMVHEGLAESRGEKYPTRLRNGEEQERHDDWSCLEDMKDYGLLRVHWTKPTGAYISQAKAQVLLLPLGAELASRLRQAKAQRKPYWKTDVLDPILRDLHLVS